MPKKKSIYIYPNNEEFYREGGNNYIQNLIASLNSDFKIINKKTKIGLLDLLFKLPKCDIIYFNWIEDLPMKRHGLIQLIILVVIIALSKILNIEIVWFVHNNISHSPKKKKLKNFIINLMMKFSTHIISHSKEISYVLPKNKFYFFQHPIDKYQPLKTNTSSKYDLLIWGTVSPYKGIFSFVNHVSTNPNFKDYKILIAGKFYSNSYYEKVYKMKSSNIKILNKILSESELMNLFSDVNYILFTYNSPSILSSAALCKTLSYGKETIGPNIGAFKELGREGLLHTYESFEDMDQLLNNLQTQEKESIDQFRLLNYIERSSWKKFAHFLAIILNNSNKEFIEKSNLHNLET